MQLLSLKHVSVSAGGHFLFSIENLTIEVGDKIALVGANASGKTTFLKSLVDDKKKPPGQAFMRRGSWSYFAQRQVEIPNTPHSEQISRWSLGDLACRQDQCFSGGENVRLRLACAFSHPHDILVLDEPTAHLDRHSLMELKRQLLKEDTYILVSHDRQLLNAFCQRTLVIENGQLIDFPGNYDAWKAWHDLDGKRQLSEYENKMREKQRLESVREEQKRSAARTNRKPRNMSRSEAKARAFGAVGKSIGGKQKHLSAAAKNTQKRIERLGDIKRPETLSCIRPDFSVTDPPQNKVIVEIEHLSFAYPGGELLFDDLAFRLKRNARVALVGENGVGKSTLIQLILRGHPNIRVVPKATFGYFDQALRNIRLDQTILENIQHASVQNETVNRAVLAQMGFAAHTLTKKAGVLSGGELTKLSFAKLFVSACNVLLIDEPSIYLDSPSYEAIETLLLNFEGSMLFCSHDAYFTKTIADEIWVLEQKIVRQIK